MSLIEAYPQLPNFLKDFEEAHVHRPLKPVPRAAKPAAVEVCRGWQWMSPEERLEAVRASLRDLAREVIDSLSGVEFIVPTPWSRIPR